jgi:uracil-DNA glycosylase family 4
MAIDGQPQLGVTLMGEALGEEEAKRGLPFIGRAGFRFGAMIERAGFKREQFQVLNAVWCQPPNNREPAAPEIDHCRQYWEHVVTRPETKVIVPMGNVSLFATTGEEGILAHRGYVEWSEKYQAFILPTVHPSFIMRGNAPWEAAFLYDLRHAVDVAASGWVPAERDYLLDPAPLGARQWVERYLTLLTTHPDLALAYDLETPDKGESEDEVNINLGFLAGPIYRCGYAYVDPRSGRTVVLSIPWDANYRALHVALLGSVGPKVVCYRHFDNPRIAAHGVVITGEKHDMQEMWHVLFSHQPKTLEFIAPFTVPTQPRWKHLNSGGTAALYNGIDAGVEIESYYWLKRTLQGFGKSWNVYRDDVCALNRVLLFMSAKGMPQSLDRRKEASREMMELIAAVQDRLNTVAETVRPTKVYTRKTSKQDGLQEIQVEKEEGYCTECGKKANKKHTHFKCGTAPGEVPLGTPATRTILVTGYVQPLDFKPSPKGLIRYALFRGYKLFTRWDKKTQSRKNPMDESTIRQYALKYETDPIWPLALEERELRKLLGTYTGYLTLTPPKQVDAEAAWFEEWRAAQFRETTIERDRRPRLTPVEPQYRPDGTFRGAEDDDIPF